MSSEVGSAVEDIKPRTFRFATRIVKLCRVLEETPGASRTLAHQLMRAGTSVGANVEEGHACQTKADFVYKYSIACKEAREAHYWLRLLVASEIMPESRVSELIDESNQLVAILTTIIRNTRKGMESDKKQGVKQQKRT